MVVPSSNMPPVPAEGGLFLEEHGVEHVTRPRLAFAQCDRQGEVGGSEADAYEIVHVLLR
ncbi:hypothetical protein GCM10020220_005530 [Nonomuraea rubra]